MRKYVFCFIVLSFLISSVSIEGSCLKFSGGEEENFFLPENKIKIEFDLSVFTGIKPICAEVLFTDYLEKEILKKKINFEKQPYASEIELNKFGVFVVDVKYLSEKGIVIKNEKTTVARIRDVRLKKTNPKSRFGIGAYYAVRFDTDKAKRAAKIQNLLGAAWDRDELLWDIGEPKKGEWNFSKYDMAVEVAHDNNILLLGLVDYWGTWAKKHTDEGRGDYANYAATLVKRYKPNGEFAKLKGWDDNYGITHWEIWNEPATFWDGTGADFGALYKKAREAMKKEDPNAVVFFSNSDEKFDSEAIKIIGIENIDGVTPHYYCPPKSPEIGKFDVGMAKTVKWFRDQGFKGPLFSSEFGWNSTDLHSLMQNQAYYLIRAFIFGIAGGHDTMISYNFFNDCLDKTRLAEGFGIMNREDFTPKLACGSYASMVYFLEGCREIKKIDFLPEVYCYIFKSDRYGAVAALWSSGADGELIVKPSKEYKLYDIMSNDISSSLEKGAIPLRQDCVYLASDKADDGALLAQMQKYLSEGEVKGISAIKLTIGQIIGAFKENPPARIIIENNAKKPVSGALTFTIPKGWALRDSVVNTGEISPGQSKEVLVFFDAMETNPENIYPLKATLTLNDGTKSEAEASINELVIPYGRPEINGDLSDWKNAKPVYLNDIAQAVGLVPYMDWNLSAKIMTMWDENNLYFAAVVTDNVFCQPHSGSLVWEGDSFQLGFYSKTFNKPTSEASMIDDKLSCILGLSQTSKGGEAWSWKCGGKPESAEPDITLEFKKDVANKYIYESSIPKKLIPGLDFRNGSMFMFSFILNDNDGGGRRGWLEWTPGIGTGFNPSYYTIWTLLK